MGGGLGGMNGMNGMGAIGSMCSMGVYVCVCMLVCVCVCICSLPTSGCSSTLKINPCSARWSRLSLSVPCY
jgi:hypothetical protein